MFRLSRPIFTYTCKCAMFLGPAQFYEVALKDRDFTQFTDGLIYHNKHVGLYAVLNLQCICIKFALFSTVSGTQLFSGMYSLLFQVFFFHSFSSLLISKLNCEILRSSIFQPCELVRHYQVLHFPALRIGPPFFRHSSTIRKPASTMSNLFLWQYYRAKNGMSGSGQFGN